MKLRRTIVVVVLALSVGAASSAEDRLVWVGVTDTTVAADQTLFGMNQQCAAKFVGARMCTTEEIMYTSGLPSGLPAERTQAWVRPIWAGPGIDLVEDGDTEQPPPPPPNDESISALGETEMITVPVVLETYSGLIRPFGTAHSCRMWSVPASGFEAVGLFLDPDGSSPGGYDVTMGTLRCTELARVACCVPRSVKVK